MANSAEKVRLAGNPNVMVCERGTTFGYSELITSILRFSVCFWMMVISQEPFKSVIAVWGVNCSFFISFFNTSISKALCSIAWCDLTKKKPYHQVMLMLVISMCPPVEILFVALCSFYLCNLKLKYQLYFNNLLPALLSSPLIRTFNVCLRFNFVLQKWALKSIVLCFSDWLSYFPFCIDDLIVDPRNLEWMREANCPVVSILSYWLKG